MFSTSQDIILVDNITGIETNLKSNGYTFAASAGVHRSRFSLIYQKTLSKNQPVLDQNNVSVYKNKGIIYIKSSQYAIDNVKIFDISGRLIFEKTKANAKEINIESLKFGNQVLIIKISSGELMMVQKIAN